MWKLSFKLQLNLFHKQEVQKGQPLFNAVTHDIKRNEYRKNKVSGLMI